MAEIERIKTYIEGLDEHLEGGIPKGSVSLISGTPGSMKSSIAFSILYNNAIKGNVKGLYITLEQDIGSMKQHMGRLKMDYDPQNKNMLLVDYETVGKGEEQIALQTNWMSKIKEFISSMNERYGFGLVVVDSLDALYSLTAGIDVRRDLYYFFKALRDTGVTSLLISEMSLDKNAYSKHGIEDFLADGIIHLDFQKKGKGLSSLERYLGIVKMRATNHDTQYFPLLFTDNKFVVFGREDLELE